LSEASLITAREGHAGTILMNRPKALNALDVGMIRLFAAAIAAWRDDPAVKLVILEGAGGRAFCAGGDVKGVREAAVRGDRASVSAFFAEEYGRERGHRPLPQALGLAHRRRVHGRRHRARHPQRPARGERARAARHARDGDRAVPDVGTSHILPRLPGALGNWLALTGARLTGADNVHAGLATHYVPREALPALRAALVETGDAGVVERFAAPLPEASFAPHRAAIDRCFAKDSVLEIITALEAEGTEWAAAQVKILRRMSPTSLCVSLELLRRGAGLDLRGCLDEELHLTGHRGA
jgi:enoyl-CoA hydratase/carnithine racemase